METREMKTIGTTPSLLGMGCMRFPLQEDGTIDVAQTQEMMDYALANGVTYIDTAYFYHNGESEGVVGEILAKYDRSSYTLATKLPVWTMKDASDTRKIFEDQLQKLRTDYIDYYLLHNLSAKSWQAVKDYGLISILEELRAEGKIKYIGFSFHDEYEVFEDIIKYYKWDFCQIQFNYMDTEEQAGLKGYQLADELGIPLVVMEPVRGGALAKLSDDMEEKFKSINPEESIASYALRYVASYPNVKVILSGMSNLEQVKDNVATFSPLRPLSQEEIMAIQEVRVALEERIQNGCTGCEYCMPCPHGVNIPQNFKLWNTYHMYQNYEPIRFPMMNLPKRSQADKCVGCGLCEAKCPQHIKISEDMPKVWADLSNPIWK
ncbi:aldo/keto reductase [Chakrabartyella piscis]|uniref:aldo/keto reductase n=1 Tax=Chakrabartyella piscis TaxID=2918914 RepID=UPI002958C61B|nr:aldo/keto reductase [Chakrabartyella piscis]